MCSNSCPLSLWCHPTTLSSVFPFSSCLQSFPESGSFPMSQFFASGGQSIKASVSELVLPMNIQCWLPLVLTGWISLLSKGLSRVFSAPQFESINSSVLSFLYGPTLTSIHDYWKNHESESDSCSVVSNSLQMLWTASCQASLSITNSIELIQTHVHEVSDAIQPSHPLSSLSPPAFNLSQYQGPFLWVSSSHQVAKVLVFQLQLQFFQQILRTDFL